MTRDVGEPHAGAGRTASRRAGTPPRRPAGRPLSVRAGVVRVAAAAVVVLALVVVVLGLWREREAGADAADARAELRNSAGGIVAEVFSVDTARWQQDRARARQLIAEEFAETFGAQLDRPPAAGTVAVTWRPEVVSIVEADADEGEALLRVAVTVRPAAEPPTTAYRSVRARFVRADDTWLLAAADVIG
ncbi:hypothetical protein [Gordonia terrae]|uniref:hypothetical protein n=1 Tax=Gordonia terrae TaxID=2055 RepID=UPI003F6D7100